MICSQDVTLSSLAKSMISILLGDREENEKKMKRKENANVKQGPLTQKPGSTPRFKSWTLGPPKVQKWNPSNLLPKDLK